MAKTWVLIAHDAGARIFENFGPGKGLDLVQEIEHPEGRERNRDIDTDRPGRSFQSADARRSAMGREESAHERTVADFARKLANKLEHARATNQYDRLVLVAPPRFLGLLRGSLDDVTATLVIGSLDKDLAHSKESELGKQLADVIRV